MRRLRLVTFNIAHGRGLSPYQGLHGRRALERNLAAIARMLWDLHPDVVALQEIDQDSRWAGGFDHLEFLRREAGFPHAAMGLTNRRGGAFRLAYGNALLSRHPLRSVETLTFGTATMGEKGLLFAELEVGGHVLPVVNLHLHFGSRGRRLEQLGMLTLFLTDKRVARSLQWHMPPIICGDLNNPAHRPDATAGLLRYLSEQERYSLHPQGKRTFPSPWPHRTLDFVFLPPACQEVSCDVPRVYLSDHRPVVVDFALG